MPITTPGQPKLNQSSPTQVEPVLDLMPGPPAEVIGDPSSGRQVRLVLPEDPRDVRDEDVTDASSRPGTAREQGSRARSRMRSPIRRSATIVEATPFKSTSPKSWPPTKRDVFETTSAGFRRAQAAPRECSAGSPAAGTRRSDRRARSRGRRRGAIGTGSAASPRCRRSSPPQRGAKNMPFEPVEVVERHRRWNQQRHQCRAPPCERWRRYESIEQRDAEVGRVGE